MVVERAAATGEVSQRQAELSILRAAGHHASIANGSSAAATAAAPPAAAAAAAAITIAARLLLYHHHHHGGIGVVRPCAGHALQVTQVLPPPPPRHLCLPERFYLAFLGHLHGVVKEERGVEGKGAEATDRTEKVGSG